MKFITAVAVFFLSFVSMAQVVTPEHVLALPQIKVPVYSVKTENYLQLKLAMNYGKAQILNADQLVALKDAQIGSVDIVFSDFPVGDKLTELTQRRLRALQSAMPSLFKSKRITWRLIRQTKCTSEEEARQLFHGIVINYRLPQSESEMAREVEFLKDFISSAPGPSDDPNSGRWKADTQNGYMFDSKKYASSSDELTKAIKVAKTFSFPDSSVSAVLKRSNWSDMAICADLTGSMSPYTAQLILWLRLQSSQKKIKQFVFFNDGDGKPDNQKEIGSTGGIYESRSTNFVDIEKLALKTMQNGGGGDMAENNIEALIKTQLLCPDCKNLVMIADNWAPIKDIALIGQVKKPVKIIVCGADFGISADYLNLARITGGSVHTMKGDLTNLVKFSEGQEMKFAGTSYRIVKGVFEKIQ